MNERVCVNKLAMDLQSYLNVMNGTVEVPDSLLQKCLYMATKILQASPLAPVECKRCNEVWPNEEPKPIRKCQQIKHRIYDPSTYYPDGDEVHEFYLIRQIQE